MISPSRLNATNDCAGHVCEFGALILFGNYMFLFVGPRSVCIVFRCVFFDKFDVLVFGGCMLLIILTSWSVQRLYRFSM